VPVVGDIIAFADVVKDKNNEDEKHHKKQKHLEN
jgi:hypothetical protein